MKLRTMERYQKTGRMGRASRTALLLSLLAISVGLSASVRLYAQTADGTLSGSIKDSSGSGIPNASVSIKNMASGEEKSATSGEDGTYVVHNLPPGTYEVTVTAAGFTGATTQVTVAAGAVQTAELTLMSTATPEENLKQGTQAACCDTMSSKEVGELPLNGRSSTDVAALEPGVLKTRTQSSGGANGFGVQMAIFGGRPRQNSSRLNGISVNDYANGPLGNAVGVALGVDTLEQLSVLTRNDQAEYGRSSGGYISSSIRSGTSNFHGSVLEYFQNTVLNAKGFFDTVRPPFHRNQFGATVGGPVFRNTFFFASYEGIRQSEGQTQVATVPSAAAWAGNLSTGTVVVDPQIARLEAFYKTPNAGLLGAGDTGVRLSPGIGIKTGNHYVGRMDHKFSGNDSLYGIYVADVGTTSGPDKLNNKLTVSDSHSQFFSLGETHTFSPHVVNSFKVGLYRMVSNAGKILANGNPLETDTSFGIIPGQTVPWLNVPGLVRLAAAVGGTDTYHLHWTSIQAYEDISWNKGAHSLKFGVTVERMRDNISAVQNPTGQVYFNSLSDFLTNRPRSVNVALIGQSGNERGFRQTMVGAYFQDNWLIRPNLTFDLGLRYEMATVPTEVQGQLSVLRNLTDAQPHLGSPLFSNPTLRNFEPRVGFGWDPFHNGRALISSGFGMFDVLPLPYEIQTGQLFSAPYFLMGNSTNLPQGSFPNGIYAIAAASTTGFGQAYFEPNPHRNYVMQWNFTTQWQLPGKFNMKLGYVGSRGVHHIFRVKDADIVLPTLTAQGYLWPSPAGSGTRLNTSAGRITAAFWEGDSHYNALVLQVKRPIGRSSQITGSYTWGKSLDTSSGSMEGDEYTNALSSPLWFNQRLNRGRSDYDIAQDLKVIYSWQVPGPKWSSSFATGLASGWQIGGVLEVSSGVPFTPGVGGDPLGVNNTDANIDVPNVLSGPGCDSLVNPGNFTHYIKTQCFAAPNPITLRGNLGRNRLTGPGMVSFDASLFKNNFIRRISDTFNVQFRSEFFNILNHSNILAPLYNRNIFDSKGNPVASGGLADATSSSSRIIQFALKVIF